MKILCLILASDTTPDYVRFQSVWRKFMNTYPKVDCYFYKGHPDLSQSEFLEDKTLWIKISESLDTVYEKTLRAFEYFVPKLDEYDFVYRSNLSTFVSFQHMLEFCAELPTTNCCAAFAGCVPENGNSLDYEMSFPGGNGFLLSTDLVRRLVEEKPPLNGQDDVTIGDALRRWKVPIIGFVRPDFRDDGFWYMNNFHLLKSNERNLRPKKNMFSYRLKSFDRAKDISTMEELVRGVYGIV